MNSKNQISEEKIISFSNKIVLTSFRRSIHIALRKEKRGEVEQCDCGCYGFYKCKYIYI